MFHILRCQKTRVEVWKTTKSRPFWRVYWNETPGALLQNGDQRVYCKSDSLVCIPPALAVEQILEQPFEHLWFHVDTPLLSNYELKIYSFRVDAEMIRRLKRLSLLLKEKSLNEAESTCLKNLVILWFTSGLQMEGSVRTTVVSELVNRAIQIMGERLQCGISTEELATLLGVSSKTLNRQFKKYVSMPPHKFLTGMRLKKAAALLFSRKLSLDEIGYKCGFCNRSHFTRKFKEAYNQSPASFRNDQSG